MILILGYFLSFSFVPQLPPEPQDFPLGWSERAETIKGMIEDAGMLYGASEAQKDLSWKIILCENSSLNPLLQSGVLHGEKREESYGLSQINLLAHPDISKEEATDALFSIDFLVKNVAQGNEKLWLTCSKQEVEKTVDNYEDEIVE